MRKERIIAAISHVFGISFWRGTVPRNKVPVHWCHDVLEAGHLYNRFMKSKEMLKDLDSPQPKE